MAKTTEEKKSVQVLPDAETGATVVGAPTWLLRLMAEEDGVPPYWSRYRDAWLREFVKRPGNDLLAGTIATVTAKVATTGWYLEGPERTANMYRRILLQRSDFGAGWSKMIQPAVWDYLTQDPGGWLERIRQGEADRQGAAIGFAHLDNAKMHLTGDPENPARYVPADGEEILLHRSQFIRIVDSPAPDEALYGVGYCAVSRALTTARILMDIARYERERLSDLPPAGLLLLNNLSRVQWEDLEKQYDTRQRQQGNQVWRDILVAFGLDPALPLGAEIFSFSELPEHFDKRTTTEIAIYSFALAFRVDPRELWPVSAGTMGTATETAIMHTKAKAKGAGLILTDIERALNDGLSIPPSLTFHFDFQDTDEDKQAAEIALLKADFIRRLTEPPLGGEALLEREEGRAWLVRQGLFDEEELLTFAPEERASDVEQAKALARVDMGPRVRAHSDGRVVRLERRRQLWRGWGIKDKSTAREGFLWKCEHCGYETGYVEPREVLICPKCNNELSHVSLKAAVEGDDGKLRPRGKPLAEWPEGKVVPITADDVARAMRKWDRDMPPEYRGLLGAEPVADAVEA